LFCLAFCFFLEKTQFLYILTIIAHLSVETLIQDVSLSSVVSYDRSRVLCGDGDNCFTVVIPQMRADFTVVCTVMGTEIMVVLQENWNGYDEFYL